MSNTFYNMLSTTLSQGVLQRSTFEYGEHSTIRAFCNVTWEYFFVIFCNVCNLFPPTLVVAHHSGDNIGAYQWPHSSTIVWQISHVSANRDCSWVTSSCQYPSVLIQELKSLSWARLPQDICPYFIKCCMKWGFPYLYYINRANQ